MKAFLLALFSASLATASTVTLNFSGTVAFIGDSAGHFNNLFTAGDTYTGTVSWDYKAEPGFSDGNGFSLFNGGPDFDMSITIGAQTFNDVADPLPEVWTVNNTSLSLIGTHPPLPSFMTFPGYTTASERLNLYGPYDNTNGDSVPDASIFRLPADPGSLAASYLQIEFDNGNTGSILLASVTSLSTTATPEPRASLLMLGGLAALLIARHTKI